jgi:uncharacterized protein (DUF433 family)
MGIRDRRELPQYSISEAAMFLDIHPATLRSWIFGRKYLAQGESRFWEPLIQPAARNPNGPALSFFNLVEIHVLAATRDFDVKVKSIRAAIEYVTAQSPSPRPLITQDFYTDGKDLFIKKLEEVINVSRSGQLGIREIVNSYLKRIQRDSFGLPLRLFPVVSKDFENNVVCITPDIGSGRPIIHNQGVRASVVWSRHLAGETIPELADDYDMEVREIEQAIGYFRHIKRAA